MSVIIFLLFATIFVVAWGRVLWYFSVRSKAINKLAVYLLSYSAYSYDQMQALILSQIYYGFGLLGSIMLIFFFPLDLFALFSVNADHFWFFILGLAAELGVVSLLIGLFRDLFMPTIDLQAEMKDIPWISGILKLPKGFLALAPALAGLVEEIFFRGILLMILLNYFNLAVWAAVTLVTILFIFEQLIQVQDRHQFIAIGSGCLAISVVGSILVIISGSIIPAGLAHAAFLMFYFRFEK